MRSSESGDGCVSDNDLDFEASYARRGSILFLFLLAYDCVHRLQGFPQSSQWGFVRNAAPVERSLIEVFESQQHLPRPALLVKT